MPIAVGGLVVLFASFVKGAVAFGFPLVATPLLALVWDVKSAVAVTIVPNIVMDGVQLVRRGDPLATVRRLAVLLPCGVAGTWLGTLLLAVLPPRAATAVLGTFVLAFAALNVSGFAPRVPPAWERWLAAPVGVAAGMLGGLTNVPGTPLVLYFYALGMGKYEFVRAVALSFLTLKLVQLGALAWFGLLDLRLLVISVGFTAVALGGFAVGLRLQDWLPERVFNRAVLAFLVVTGLWLVARSV